MQAETPLKVGTLVGAGRWPYVNCHPESWGRPWKGTLLAQTDVRAWVGTLAFPFDAPTQEAVDAHVARCHSQDLLLDKVPVLWDFSENGETPPKLKVWWESIENVVSYEEDYANWLRAKEKELKERERAKVLQQQPN